VKSRLRSIANLACRVGLVVVVAWLAVSNPKMAPFLTLAVLPQVVLGPVLARLVEGVSEGAEDTVSKRRAELFADLAFARFFLPAIGFAYFGGLVVETVAGISLWAVFGPALLIGLLGWLFWRRSFVRRFVREPNA
jgi:hypothetical protein